jgi:hypothetical protein
MHKTLLAHLGKGKEIETNMFKRLFQENLFLSVTGGKVTTAANFSVSVVHRELAERKYFVDGRLCLSYTFLF